MNVSMDSLRFRSWKDFSLCWWNMLASAWFPGIRHFENFTIWIQLSLGLRNCAWKATNGNSWKSAKLSMTILSKFSSQDHNPIYIHGSSAHCSNCITEQITSEVVDVMFFGWPLACHFTTRQIWGIWKLRPAFSLETPNLGKNWWCFVPCDLEIWWMTLENNRASLRCCFKLCATFHSHWWIQTGVTVRKRPIWVKFNDF